MYVHSDIPFTDKMAAILKFEAILDLRTWIKCKFLFILV